MIVKKWARFGYGLLLLTLVGMGCNENDAPGTVNDSSAAEVQKAPPSMDAPAAAPVVAIADGNALPNCPHAKDGGSCPHKGAGKCEHCPYANAGIDDNSAHKEAGKCDGCPCANAGGSGKCAHHDAAEDDTSKPTGCPHHWENGAFQP
ncbi:MAG: hypothetical protein JXR76_00235 [Deltaproteobacteria bacterium]|nr:hypothetical protein [Deltaproteobacteria bacterium]